MAKIYPSIAACDFGSSSVSVLLCEIAPKGLDVIGFGQSHSRGIRRGVIVNIESAVSALEEALKEAQSLGQRDIDALVVGVSGPHVQCLSSHGMVAVRDKEIKRADVDKVLEAASAVNLPLDREVIQVVPQEFLVDGQEGIHQPLAMYGRRLEANIQLITGSITSLQNIRRVLEKADIGTHHFISTPLASARAVLTAEEREAGVCVVDIGAASTDLAVFQEGVLKCLKSIPIGGMHLTNDLAVGLKTGLKEADKIKHQYGCPLDSESCYENIEIPGLVVGESRRVAKEILRNVLEPRVEEIMHLVRDELAKEGLDSNLPTGIVVTGGTSALKGIIEIAQRIFQLPVRMGRPNRLGGLSEMISSPSFSSLVGLVQLGFEESEDLKYFASFYQKKGLKKVQAQVTRWVKDFF